MELGNLTSKSLGPRAYQIAEMTKKKKVEKRSLNMELAMMTKVEMIMEEGTADHQCHAITVERKVTSLWIALSLKSLEIMVVMNEAQ